MDSPGPWRLTLVTNPDDCNLACAMCPCGAARAPGAPRPARAPRRLAPALALAVLEERRGSALAEVVPSTLGEPLLWPGLDALIDRCDALGLRLNLTTNGSWPGRGAAGWARRLVPVASDVKVSWNGAIRATLAAIQGGLDLDLAVEGVRTLVRLRDEAARAGGPRCGVSFQVTAQAANVDELAGVVRLAADLGVDRVKLNHLQPRPGLAVTEEGSLRRDRAGLRRWNGAVAQVREAAAEAAARGRPVRVENAAALAEDPAAPAPYGPCPFLGREAWLHPDGRFAPCPHPAAAGLGELGNVTEQALGAIWAGPALATLAGAWPAHPLCQKCSLRRPGGA